MALNPLWLDKDVATWLHVIADADFNGDVEKAMNSRLRSAMIAEENPELPWAALEQKLAAKSGFRK